MTGSQQAMMGGEAPMVVSLDTTHATGTTTGTSATSNTVSATVSGGTAPYSYSWAVTNEGDAAIFAVSPTTPATAFRDNDLSPGDFHRASAILTVTDALMRTADSATVTCNLRNTLTP